MFQEIASLINCVPTLIDRLIPDKTEAAKVKLRYLELQQNGELSAIASASKIIVAETQSESWLARNWRPLTMTMFSTVTTLIIFNNHILIPYVSFFCHVQFPSLELPKQMWELLFIGIGGYIGCRTAEKLVKTWKEK